jgi:predicted porin
MKKSHIAVAAMAVFAAAGTAHAQSSVTIFGIVDMALTSVDQGGKRLTSLANEGQASNRIGFRGVEDLGGGLKAEFWLESGMSPDAGTPGGVNFLRKSTLGLKGGFGEVRLGRDYTPTFSNHSAYTVFGTNGLGNSLNTFTVLRSGASTGVRADNSIGYFTPVISGFQGQLMVGLKEQDVDNNPNEYTGLRLTYNAGPLSASLATASEGSSVQTSNYKRTNLGATYDFGVAKVFFFHLNAKFGQAKNKQTAIGLTAPVGPGTVKFSYMQASYNAQGTAVFVPAVTAVPTATPPIAARAAQSAQDDATHITIGYDYPLSKRTVVYGLFSRISNDGVGQFSVAYGNGPATAGAVERGGNSTGYAVGIRHSF